MRAREIARTTAEGDLYPCDDTIRVARWLSAEWAECHQLSADGEETNFRLNQKTRDLNRQRQIHRGMVAGKRAGLGEQ